MKRTHVRPAGRTIILCCILTAALASAQPAIPEAPMMKLKRNGTELRARPLVDSFRFKTEQGEVELKFEALIHLDWWPQNATVRSNQGEWKGRMVTAEIPLSTEFGTVAMKAVTGQVELLALTAEDEKAFSRANALVERFRPVRMFKLNSNLADIILSGDRRWVYFLNRSTCTLHRFNAVKEELDPQALQLTRGTEGICMPPSGKVIYSHASPTGHGGSTGNGKSSPGKFHVINPEDFRLASTISAMCDPWRMAADEDGYLYVTPTDERSSGITVIDASSGIVAGTWPASTPRLWVALDPNGHRLILGSPAGGTPFFRCFAFGTDRTAGTSEDALGPFVGGVFEVAPDGRWIVSDRGGVFNIGGPSARSWKVSASLPSNTAVAFARNGSLLLVATHVGELRIYALPNFDLRATLPLGVVVRRMAFDEESGTLYCTVMRDQEPGAPHNDIFFLPEGKQDLAIYDLHALLNKK